MASVILSDEAIADLSRLAHFLADSDPAAAAATGPLIIGALRLLETHPRIGTRSENGRYLVISRGASGYVAHYVYDPVSDRVVVHAVRHQRESGLEDRED